jgi:hypothetical protein
LWAGSRVAKSAGALEPPQVGALEPPQVGALEPPQVGKARSVPAPAPEALGRRKDWERMELWWKDAVVAIDQHKTTIQSATFSKQKVMVYRAFLIIPNCVITKAKTLRKVRVP